MILAQVEGSVTATKKNARMQGSKFLVVRPMVLDSATAAELRPLPSTLVATDTLGAGEGDLVLIVQGSSARLGAPDDKTPVDAVVIGIVDTVDQAKRLIYRAR